MPVEDTFEVETFEGDGELFRHNLYSLYRSVGELAPGAQLYSATECTYQSSASRQQVVPTNTKEKLPAPFAHWAL
jgi:hypothetical protein